MIPKFRAFIKIKNAINPVQPVGAINFESETITIEQGLTFPFDKAILMQYTGLKDKNGVEIYEGDIVSVHDGKHIKPIIFYQGAFFAEDLFPYEVPYDCKVIGNIYENSELIE